MDHELDATRLRLFAAVAEHGSISAAARAQGYTQPAVSHAVRRLERDVGVALIRRVARGIVLTEAGTRLSVHAEVILTVMRSARAELADLAAGRTGRVRVAAFPSAAATVVPPVLARLRHERPTLVVELLHAEPDQAIAMVSAGEADIAVTFAYPDTDEPPGLQRAHMFDDQLFAVLPPDDPSIPAPDGMTDAAAPLELDALADRRWIAGCPRCRAHLEDACRTAGFVPRVVHSTDDYVAVQAMVAAGLGIALLPDLALRAYVRADVTTAELRPRFFRRVTVSTLDVTPQAPSIQAVLKALERATAPRTRTTVGPSASFG